MKTVLLSSALMTWSFLNAQETYVPDNVFESYLESNSMGNGIPNDDYVTTANISGVSILNISAYPISDLTGVEDFTALTYLDCSLTPLVTLDVSQNTLLSTLRCYSSQITSLDVSQNTSLTELICYNLQLSSLDVTQNTALAQLVCYTNQLTYLDLSQNTALTDLRCNSNELLCLSLKNGNNTNISYFESSSNPNLSCIEVDDDTYSTINWTNIDPTSSFSTSCVSSCAVGLEELNSVPRQLLQIVDLMGRETKYKPNTVLIYIYSDGTTERMFRLMD